jgi:hypothetical protein
MRFGGNEVRRKKLGDRSGRDFALGQIWRTPIRPTRPAAAPGRSGVEKTHLRRAGQGWPTGSLMTSASVKLAPGYPAQPAVRSPARQRYDGAAHITCGASFIRRDLVGLLKTLSASPAGCIRAIDSRGYSVGRPELHSRHIAEAPTCTSSWWTLPSRVCAGVFDRSEIALDSRNTASKSPCGRPEGPCRLDKAALPIRKSL